MNTNWLSKWLAASTLCVLPALQLAGCGDSDSTKSGPEFPDAGAGAAVATGGFTATGGFGATGFGATGFGATGGTGATGLGGTGGTAGGGTGATSALDSGIADSGAGDASADPCDTANTAIIDPDLFPVCDQCPAARCVPTTVVPADVADQLGDCDAENKCVPDFFVATGGNLLLETCESLDGAEGRCVPACLPAVQSQADFLPQDICADDEVCAPCFDPTTGDETGACGVGCDPGAQEDPVTFEKCCGLEGSCVPTALVPTDLQSSLGSDTCSDTTRLCAPDVFVDTTYQPLVCTSVAGAEGRCIPDCVPAVSDRASFLPTDICSEGELCAPCTDPTTGELTGACSINGDGPQEPPVIFASCCGDLGICVPTSLVPTDQQGLLDANTCTGTDELCAPTTLTDSSYQPPTCDSIAGAEGRCLPACLPDIAAQADRLPQDACDEGHLCAPCYDPVTLEATGACDLNGDAPADPPTGFEKCCSGNGSCVDTSLVPTEQQSLLGSDTCTDPSMLCAPDKLTDPTYVPATCASIGGFEGRCLADCIPEIAAQADRLPQDACDAGELCAPCYDPISGDATGACAVNGDAPVNPPQTFENCCGDLGSCVPSTAVPVDQQSLLDENTCTTQGYLCVPDDLADPSYQPPECDSISGFEGRCLPACLPDVAAQADRLPQDICDPGLLCAPCYDPITGELTGACDLNGDSPNNPPETFEKCCSDNGSCVDTSLVPTEQQTLLGSDTCSDPGMLCAPDKLTDSSYLPATCASIGGFEGRCLADCIPEIAAQADRLPQDLCDTGELCAPCYDPITGESTGACEVNGDAPVDPPGTFEDCCGGLGSCVPSTAVPTDQQSLLDANTCSTQGDLCVPDDLADTSYVPPTCSSIGGFEGRCLPACLPDIAAQADRLPQDICDAGHLCAPCYDPISGEPTGACDLNGDAPVEPPGTFEKCCGGDGSCVPTSIVPVDQQSLLGADTCTTADTLCAPDKLTEPTYIPETCRSFGSQDREGRCIAACVPQVADMADQLQQETCADGELCAPCYNPIDGTDTGACRINGDAPVDPNPGRFETCDAYNLFCPGPPCNPCDGRCVPEYIVPDGQAGLLLQGTCAGDELCAPCYSPIDGTPTGACGPDGGTCPCVAAAGACTVDADCCNGTCSNSTCN